MAAFPSSPQRILFINYEFPPIGGGGGRANAEIARAMANLGHSVLVLTVAYRGLPRKEWRDGYEIRRIPALRRYPDRCRPFEMAAFLLSSLFYSLWIAARFRPQWTLAFFTLPSAPAAWLIRLFFRVPYLVSLRGGDVPGFMPAETGFYHALSIPLTRFLWRHAHAVVANSQGLRELALRTLPDLSISVIPNGVDERFFRPMPVVEEERTRTPFHLLTVGRLSPQKGVDLILRAIARLPADSSRELALSVVGDGPERKKLEALVATLSLQDRVRFYGWQDEAKLREFYGAADGFILASHFEGMPNALLEAMASGLPVIATRVAGTEELVSDGENGRLVPPDNIEALEQAIRELSSLSLREWRARARRSREQAETYTWHRVGEAYLGLCKEPGEGKE